MISKFLETLIKIGFDSDKIELEEDTLYNVIKKKKGSMKMEEVDDFIITFQNEKETKTNTR